MKTPFALIFLGGSMALIHWVFLAVTIFFLFDLRARYAEYLRCQQRLVDAESNPYTRFNLDDLIDRKQQTRCQREVMISAARTVNDDDYVREIYHQMGYRWYHFLPAWMFNSPQRMLTLAWWKVFLGMK